MNPEQFFKEFNTFVNAPNGIQKLRNYIYFLGSNGYLTNGVIEEESLKNHLPNSWQSLALSEVSEIVMGQAPPGNECNKNGIGTVFVKTGEFGERFPEVKEWTTKPLRMAYPGDVLICVVGATAGKLNQSIECAIGRSVAAIRPSEHLDSSYLYYFLQLKVLDLRNSSRGSAQRVITKVQLEKLIVPMPPLEEQERIVARVDELMELCDQLEEEQQATKAFSDELRVSTFHHMVQSEKPEDVQDALRILIEEPGLLLAKPEDVEDLRKVIMDLAVKGKLADQITVTSSDCSIPEWELEPLKLKDSEIWEPEFWGLNLPENWFRCPLAYLGKWGSGGTPKRSNSEYFGGTIPWLVIGDLNNGYVHQSTEKITKLGLEKSSAKMIPSGSVLFAMYGASIGKLGISGFECSTNQAIAHCIPHKPLVTTRYLFLILYSLKKSFINKGKGGAQPNINQIILKHCLIYLPPLEEQERIVSRVDELMELCDQLEEELSLTVGLSEEYVLSSSHHLVS
jgi:type I restriction enzyme, S subunit